MADYISSLTPKNRPAKLLLTLFTLLAMVTLVYLFIILPTLKTDIHGEKMRQTTELVDLGLSVLHHFHAMEEEGLISGEEARKGAAEMVRSMRYGDNDLDYFWINDLEAFMIVHPIRPDLEGKHLKSSEDPADAHVYNLFTQIVELCQVHGSGHLTYDWQYYDEADRLEEKLSYVALFEPWEWIIGTGVYLTDLEAVLAQRRNVATALMLIFCAAIGFIIYFYHKSKAREVDLQGSEEKYRLIAENTADTITVLDMDLKYLFVSPSIYKLHGYTVEEALSRSLEQTLTPESLQLALETFNREIALLNEGKSDPGKTIQLELEEYRKDGSTIWVENSLSFMRDRKGKPVGILTVSKDITERKKQQEALQKEQREKTIILENLTERVTYLDPEMRIIWANSAVSKTHGKSPGEYLGRRCFEVWHGYSEPCPGCPVHKSIQTGRQQETVLSYPDGRSWRVTGAPVFDENGKMIGALDTALEVTELKLAEDSLRKLNQELEERVKERTAQLEQANRELTAFTYSVSHDLRSPLRSIAGFSEIVLEEYADVLDEQGKNYLKRVISAGTRMGELIDDLLKLSRVTRHEIQPGQIDLSAIAQECATSLREKEPGRSAELVIEPGCQARGDASLLRIALENLFENAWKYSRKSEHTRIEFGTTGNNLQHTFYISDNGVGFNMAYCSKIFEPFHRLHNASEYSGTGIGLSIVQRIVERHNGSIWAEAEEGKGATFYFNLPY